MIKLLKVIQDQGGSLAQYGWCPYKKGKFGHRDKVTVPKPRSNKTYQKGREEAGSRFSPTALRRSQPRQHLDFRPLASGTVRQRTAVVSATSLWYLVLGYGSQSK
jgi:hypothetical protein